MAQLICTHLIFHILWLHCITIFANVISKYVHCFDQPGNDPSYIVIPKYSRATCPSSYIMTSCGAKPVGTANTQLLGAYISGNDCVANTLYNSFGCPPVCPGGMRAYARCCNLTDYGSSFKRYTSTLSGTNDDNTATISCLSNTEELIGCDGHSNGGKIFQNDKYFDGILIGDESSFANIAKVFDTRNQCNAKNGFGGKGVYSYATCYDKYTMTDGYSLDCNLIWGPKSNDNGIATSLVTCPSDIDNYFMTSCGGYSLWSQLAAYTIENNICTVSHYEYDTNDLYAVANAICCRITKPTDNPTIDPTANPTMEPSIDPTIDPTNNPTLYPTIDPTYNPTNDPTELTKNPTIYPTDDPSIFPTVYPTKSTSQIPTYHPSNKPTKRPVLIFKPTKKPTDIIAAEVTMTSNLATVYIVRDSEIVNNNKRSNIERMISLMIIFGVLFCCICMIVFTLRYLKNNKKRIIQHGVSKNDDKTMLYLAQISKSKSNTNNNEINGEHIDDDDDDGDYDDEGDGTGTDIKFRQNHDIITSGNINDNKYVTKSGNHEEVHTESDDDDDDDDDDEIIMVDINNHTVGDDGDIEITGSDEETPGTEDDDINDSDTQTISNNDDDDDDDDGNRLTMDGEQNKKDKYCISTNNIDIDPYKQNNDINDELMIKIWMENTVKLPEYYDQFIMNGYEKLDFIKDIKNKDELIDIGIIDKQHQNRFLLQIGELQ